MALRLLMWKPVIALSPPSDIPTYTEIFGQTIVKLARADSRIVAITAAMCDGTGLDQFCQEFPDRFYDVGIAEQHAVTFAAGLAIEGLIPVVAIYSTFLQRAYDQIVYDVCLQNWAVRPLKWYASWVQNVVRQFGAYSSQA